MPMDEAELDRVAAKLVDALRDNASEVMLGYPKHHHDFVEMLIGDRERAVARREAVIKQVGGWGVIVVLTGIGAAVWQFVKEHIR